MPYPSHLQPDPCDDRNGIYLHQHLPKSGASVGLCYPQFDPIRVPPISKVSLTLSGDRMAPNEVRGTSEAGNDRQRELCKRQESIRFRMPPKDITSKLPTDFNELVCCRDAIFGYFRCEMRESFQPSGGADSYRRGGICARCCVMRGGAGNSKINTHHEN
jgi:hypothetical protein